MKKTKFLISAFVFTGMLQNVFCQDAALAPVISPKLEKVWEITDGLLGPECAYYHSDDNTIYVSNMVGPTRKPEMEKGPIGYLSKIDTKGQFIEKEWVKGLKSPKGIAVYKNKLYVTDVKEVLEIDLKTAKIVKRYTKSTVKGLNDLCVDTQGKVYTTDMVGNVLYSVGKDSLEVFVETGLSKLNGLLVSENKIIMGSSTTIISIDLKTKETKTIVEKAGMVDGLLIFSDTKFLISAGAKIVMIEIGKKSEILLDLNPLKVAPADFGYIPSQKLLIVPSIKDSHIVAYKMNL